MVPVLIVDGDQDVRELLRLTLDDAEYAVVEVSDERSALDTLRTRPDHFVVLVNHNPPHLDGEAVLQAMAADRHLATRHGYLLTAINPLELSVECFALLTRLGGSVVRMPLDLDMLLELIAQAASKFPSGPGSP
jgi:CheY-like chemotaxis protein